MGVRPEFNHYFIDVPYDDKVYGNLIDPIEWNANFLKVEEILNSFAAESKEKYDNESSTVIPSPAIYGLGADTAGSVFSQLVLIAALLNGKADRAEYEERFANTTQSIVYDEKTGVFTITKGDGTVTQVDLATEKIPVKFELTEDEEKVYLKMTNEDGSFTKVDMSRLLNLYNFLDSDTITWTLDESMTDVRAALKAGSLKKEHMCPELIEWLNSCVTSCTTSMAAADASATSASTSATQAAASAQAAKTSEINAGASSANAEVFSNTATTAAQQAQTAADQINSTHQAFLDRLDAVEGEVEDNTQTVNTVSSNLDTLSKTVSNLIENAAYIKVNTKSYWAKQTSYIPPKGELVVYSDYAKTEDGKDVPNVKIGDGKAYVVDLPFVNDDMREVVDTHVLDGVIHITAAERAAWNNKVRCFVDTVDDELVVFTTD